MKYLSLLVAICVLFGTLGFLGYGHVSKLGSEVGEANAKYLSLREKFADASENLRKLRGDLSEVENKLENAREEIALLREGNRYELHDPTYAEVEEFIREDETDENHYRQDEYTCVNFASDVNNHASQEGIRCATVYLYLEGEGHSLVAFDTIDRGLVYVETEYDVIIPELEVGQEYWDVVDKYSEMGFEESLTTRSSGS